MFFLWILLRFFLSNYALPTLSSLEISTHSSLWSHQPSCCGAFRPLLGLFLPLKVPSHFLGQFCPSSLCQDRADLQQDPIYSPSGPFSLTCWYPQSWEPRFELPAVGTICCCNYFASKKGWICCHCEQGLEAWTTLVSLQAAPLLSLLSSTKGIQLQAWPGQQGNGRGVGSRTD